MTPASGTKVAVIGDEVKIELELEAVRQPVLAQV
jgi:hypothetical protein